MIELKYDPELTDNETGEWRCKECGNVFYGGGLALHKNNCSKKDYSNCVLVIGPDLVSFVKEWAVKNGEDCNSPTAPVSLKEIKEQLPQVL